MEIDQKLQVQMALEHVQVHICQRGATYMSIWIWLIRATLAAMIGDNSSVLHLPSGSMLLEWQLAHEPSDIAGGVHGFWVGGYLGKE
jgi:hypothetical protein